MTSRYLQIGVDIEKNEKIVEGIKTLVESSYPDECQNVPIFSFGNFGGAIPIPKNIHKYLYENQKDDLILISSMDGVGTKSEFVLKYNGINGFVSLGMDLINHCVNDTVVGGGIPLCFLDYVASQRLDPDLVALFVKGLVMACKENSNYLENQITLVGGESAEMPDTYKENKYDLVGTMIGYQFRSNLEKILLDPIIEGDIVLGFKSNSPHTNGYSLIRKGVDSDMFKNHPKLSENDKRDFIKWCCLPHLSYLDLLTHVKIKKIKFKKSIHITGGGWKHNPPRVLPTDLKINFNIDDYWENMYDKVYWEILQEITESSIHEMTEVFNCGIGLMIIISNKEYLKHKDFFDNNLGAKNIGTVIN